MAGRHVGGDEATDYPRKVRRVPERAEVTVFKLRIHRGVDDAKGKTNRLGDRRR